MPESHAALHRTARERGVQPVVYRLARLILVPFFRVYFRLRGVGVEHVPATGPVIFAANHRSFLDPFVIGACVKRPVYYVAKQELFLRRWQAWILNALGAFPVARGQQDDEMLETARTILGRGDAVLIFPEGTRIRPGALGRPKKGVGRLALEMDAPVVPVAVIGTEAVRRGLRIRPHRVGVRFGRALAFPQVPSASPELAQAVTDRIWPNVMLQWEWLGGLPPIRRVAVVGAGAWGTALATRLARTGVEVDLATRASVEEPHRPGIELPEGVSVVRSADLELSRHDLVVFAVPAAGLPSAVAEHGAKIAPRTGILVTTTGLVAPLGTLPTAYVAERTVGTRVATLAGPAHATDALGGGAALVVGAADAGLGRQLRELLVRAGFDAHVSADPLGVELAAAGKDVAALAAAVTADAGPDAAGGAAGKVFAEVEALARAAGSDGAAFAGLAGAGDLVATVLAASHRPGGLPAGTTPPGSWPAARGRTAEAIDTTALLVDRADALGVAVPALTALAAALEGQVERTGLTVPGRAA